MPRASLCRSTTFRALVALARRERVEFVVVGPEVPLALGLVDALIAAGIPAYGPKADGARLEASKIYTKEILLQKYRIPTGGARDFSTRPNPPSPGSAAGRGGPIVVKADGLAGGKGVVVARSPTEAEAAVRELLALGAAGAHPGPDSL